MRAKRLTTAEKPRVSEYTEQCIVVEWFHWNCHRWLLPYYALIAIPNANALYGQARNRFALMKKLRNQGVRPGAPDLILPVARVDQGNLLHGLAMEMKALDGATPTEEQDLMLAFFKDQYWMSSVPRGAAQAIDVLKDYLDLPPPR